MLGKYSLESNKVIFTISKVDRPKLEKLLENQSGNISIIPVTKISIVGSGISNHLDIFQNIINTFEDIKESVIDIDVSACKISILLNKIIDIKYLNELHEKLIKDC